MEETWGKGKKIPVSRMKGKVQLSPRCRRRDDFRTKKGPTDGNAVTEKNRGEKTSISPYDRQSINPPGGSREGRVLTRGGKENQESKKCGGFQEREKRPPIIGIIWERGALLIGALLRAVFKG